MPQTIYIKDYNQEVEIPDGADMVQVQAALQKQFPPKSASIPTTPSQPTPPQTPSGQTPDWAGQYPNLYGVLGAARETLGPVMDALGLGLGSVAGGGPAFPAGAVAGAGIGMLASKRAQRWADIELGNRPPDNPLSQANEMARNTGEGMMYEAGGQVLGKGLQVGFQQIGKVAKQILGTTTGTGGGSIEVGVKGSQAFKDSMKGKVSGEEVVDNVKNALQMVKNERANNYQKGLVEVTQNKEPINISPIKDKFEKLLKSYGVKVEIDYDALGDTAGINPEYLQKKGVDLPTKLVFDRSVFGKAAQKDVAEIADLVNGWGTKEGDNTAIKLDTLKRRLDDFYSDSSQARQFVASMRDVVKKQIVDNVDGYETMTKGYEESTRLIKDIEKSLMVNTGNKYTADQTLRRLTSSMRESFEMRRDLLNVLGEKGAQDLEGQVAGYAMSPWVPRGLVGKLYGGAVGYMMYLNPKFLPLIAASSPRTVGEFLTVYGKAMNEAKLAAPATSRTMAYGILNKLGNQGGE